MSPTSWVYPLRGLNTGNLSLPIFPLIPAPLCTAFELNTALNAGLILIRDKE